MSAGEDSAASNRARVIRRKATKVGLKLRQRGNIYELLDVQGDSVMCGGICAVENHIADLFVSSPPGPAPVALPAGWAALISAYCLTLAAGGQSSSTVRLRRLTLAHIARGLNAPTPDDVSAAQLVAWFGRQTHWSRSTRRVYRSAARGFFAWAYKYGLVDEFICDDLPKIRETPPSPRPVPDSVWRDAIAAADPRVTVMLRLAAEAGLRRAEVAQVHTRDLIDDGHGAALVVHGKGDKDRIVPIDEPLVRLVRAGACGHTPGLPATGWLFPADGDRREGDHLTPERVGALVNAVLPQGYSMHKLRHRFATRAYRGTRNLRAVQTLLGHSSVATTERYTAVDADEIRAAALAAIWPTSPRTDGRGV